MAPVALAPEIASFDCGSLNFGERVFVNSPTFLRELATRMNATGVKPEIECFEPGHVWNALRLIDEGLLRAALLVPVRAGRARRQPAGGEAAPAHGRHAAARERTGRSAASAGRSCRWAWRRWRWAATCAPGWRTTSGTARASWRRATRSSWRGWRASPPSWGGRWRRRRRCGRCSGCAAPAPRRPLQPPADRLSRWPPASPRPRSRTRPTSSPR